MVGGLADEEPISLSIVLRSSVHRLVMDDNLAAGRCKGLAHEVVVAVEECVGGELGVDSRRSEHVDGIFSVLKEQIPRVAGEGFMCAFLNGDEVGFDVLDGTFGRIGSMIAGGGKLVG